MNQVSKIFIGDPIYNKASELSKYLVDEALNYGINKNLEIITISHFCYWYSHKIAWGSKVQNLQQKILINSIYKKNELGKKMTYDKYGKLIPLYQGGLTDNIIIHHYGNNGWKYPFWKLLSNKIMSRQIANIKNSYLEIYQELNFTMKLRFTIGWHENIFFDTHQQKIEGSQGMCHFIILNIDLDFTENIFKPKPEQVKPVKTGWFSSKPKKPERPNFGYTQIATDEDIYIEIKKLL
jgi:hypothetical protein